MADEGVSVNSGSTPRPASSARPPAPPPLDRLLEAEQLKNVFLASLSHEFRTPLNVILGYLDLLEEAATPEEGRNLRGLIRRHTGSMLTMLDNTLYLADLRLDRVVLEPEVFALEPLLARIARETEVLWGRPTVPLRLVIGEDVDTVRTDKRALRQIVKNLLANALCFTETGEVLLEVRLLPLWGTVEISVADSGPGIPPLDREHLFEEYTALRAHAPGQCNPGLGIGLPVAKQLATLIGGSLELERTEEWSSVFRFRFPVGTGLPAGDLGRAATHVPREAASVSPRPPMRAAGTFKCPPFPAILGVIARALQDPAGDDRDVRRAVRSDEALSLTLLHRANAASLARARPVTSIDDSLAVVGLAGLRSIVLTKFVHSLFTRWGRAEEFLWEHALAAALAAPRLRVAPGIDDEELYLCGLLHNVGKVVLNGADPTRYANVLLAVSREGAEFCEAERAVFGVAHTTFGADLVRDANIPETVKESVLRHHETAAPPVVQPICPILVRADAVAYRASPAWASMLGTNPEPGWIAGRLASPSAGLAGDALSALVDSVRADLDGMRLLLRR